MSELDPKGLEAAADNAAEAYADQFARWESGHISAGDFHPWKRAAEAAILAYLQAVEQEKLKNAPREPLAFGDSRRKRAIQLDEEAMYPQAIMLATRDTPSVSYVQRKLKIGYNLAAAFFERMVKEGYVTAPDRSGRRVILKPWDSALSGEGRG